MMGLIALFTPKMQARVSAYVIFIRIDIHHKKNGTFWQILLTLSLPNRK